MPITGFANSVVAPAIEFHAEGEVFGVGCKIFTIAGPVILYGVLTSWVLGLIYWGWEMDGGFFNRQLEGLKLTRSFISRMMDEIFH